MAAPRTDGMAITALVLSIASFVICFGIPAIIALILIPGSRRNIRASGGALEGEGLLTAAKIISLINLGLVVAGVAVVIIVAIVNAGSSTNNTSLAHSLLLLQ